MPASVSTFTMKELPSIWSDLIPVTFMAINLVRMVGLT